MILQYSILPAVVLWLIIVACYFLKHHSWRFKKFNFSVRHYYIMISPLIIGLIINAWRAGSIKSVVLFIIFAFAGVIGELLVDLWWQKFYLKSLWIYNVETVYRRYTSWLNFIPWALGGFLYLNVANRIVGDKIFLSILPISFTTLTVAIFLQIFLFNLLKPVNQFRFHRVTLLSLVVVYLPIIFMICTLASVYGSIIYQLALWFAIIGTVAEYLFGKACHFFISRKLWNYTYLSVDNGHFTPLAIPLFCIGGFYFWIIGRIMFKL